MDHTLHIIAACADRKRGVPAPEHRLRSHAAGTKRAARWTAALADGPGARVPLEELYVGDHWAVARAVSAAALAQGWKRAPLWVASAGVGLSLATTAMQPYSATFASRHADSVVDASVGTAPAVQRRAWWGEVTAAAGTSLRDVARRESNASFLFIGSRPYVDAVGMDLAAALAELRHPDRLVIVSSRSARTDSLSAHTVEASANMRASLGGALPSLHARLARHIVAQLGPETWSAQRAIEVGEVVRRGAVLPALPVRTPLSDTDVIAFITRRLREDSGLAATPLLRELRTSGRACEQARFRKLYTGVRT